LEQDYAVRVIPYKELSEGLQQPIGTSHRIVVSEGFISKMLRKLKPDIVVDK
jgi:hypothetical protein